MSYSIPRDERNRERLGRITEMAARAVYSANMQLYMPGTAEIMVHSAAMLALKTARGVKGVGAMLRKGAEQIQLLRR